MYELFPFQVIARFFAPWTLEPPLTSCVSVTTSVHLLCCVFRNRSLVPAQTLVVVTRPWTEKASLKKTGPIRSGASGVNALCRSPLTPTRWTTSRTTLMKVCSGATSILTRWVCTSYCSKDIHNLQVVCKRTQLPALAPNEFPKRSARNL